MALVRTAGLLSLAASMIHAGVAPRHFSEWWGYGVFFVVASVAQGVYGLVLLALPARPSWAGPTYERWKRRLFFAGIAGNLLVIGLYLLTRTAGVPLVGPASGTVEDVAAIDVVSKGVELALVTCLVLLLRTGAASEDLIGGPAPSRLR
ncbi:MAG: hypothetical protein ACT4PT_00255 [Methanobacteriota archaeon]